MSTTSQASASTAFFSPMRTRRRAKRPGTGLGKLALGAAALLVLLAPGAAFAQCTTTQLTDNAFNDTDPRIHNGQVVWQGWDGSDNEIFFWDGFTTTQFTDNASGDFNPRLHNGQVVWQGWDGSDNEIFLYDGVTTINISNNALEDFDPRIHNGQVVWRGWYGSNYEILFWDGVSTTQLTDNALEDFDPQIHNGQVVWQGWDGSDWEIFFWDGVSTTQLTDNASDDLYSRIHNGQVVWSGWDGSDYEIFLYDGVTTINISNNALHDFDPRIHNGQVVWRADDGSDNEIFLYDGFTTTQLTNNSFADVYPWIHNGQVVWEGSDGSDWEIFFWDGFTTTQFTDNALDDFYPRIHNGQVVWYGSDGSDTEIFYTKMYPGVCGCGVPDDPGYEPNESFATAFPIGEGLLYDARICVAADYDYYSITLASGGTLDVDMHPPVGLDYDLFLYDSSETLVDYSILAGDATEMISYTATAGGTYYVLVRGHDGTQWSTTQFYTLIYGFTPCPTPDEEVYIYMVTVDANSNTVLHFQDPNQPSEVTGYNVYRSMTSPAGPWDLEGSNVTDMDGGTANIQWTDQDSASCTTCYYEVTPYNAACGAEGPM
ncbi:MAG: pre-peptidase C-terminal domain-containing protein [Acidobacteriota bacterium]|nr:MAG: pre-peptidase C-terminal domain-containing protein [Acidobacteriota bacterium]